MLARAVELFFVFFLLPTVFSLSFKARYLIPLLFFIIAFLCLRSLLADKAFDRKQLWNPEGLKGHIRRILMIFVMAAVIIGLGLWWVKQELLLGLVLKKPLVWAFVMIFYPLISVYPQELVFRTFFFQRYRKLFPGKWFIIGASAAAFGYMHIVFQNSIAIIFSFAGGILFAYTYGRTRSTLAASLEHALYGCYVLTIGLHKYFFLDAISLSKVAQKLFER